MSFLLCGKEYLHLFYIQVVDFIPYLRTLKSLKSKFRCTICPFLNSIDARVLTISQNSGMNWMFYRAINCHLGSSFDFKCTYYVYKIIVEAPTNFLILRK